MITHTLASFCKYNPVGDGEALLREALTTQGLNPSSSRRNNESTHPVDVILSRLAVDDSNIRVIVGFALDCVERVCHRTENRAPRETVRIARQFLGGTVGFDKLWAALVITVDAAREADAARAAVWKTFEAIERNGQAAVAAAERAKAESESTANTIYAAVRRASLLAYILAAMRGTQDPYEKSVAATIGFNAAAGSLHGAKYRAAADRRDANAAYERAQAVANVIEAAADAAAAVCVFTTEFETATEYVFSAVMSAAMGAADFDDEREWQGQRLLELINGLTK